MYTEKILVTVSWSGILDMCILPYYITLTECTVFDVSTSTFKLQIQTATL